MTKSFREYIIKKENYGGNAITPSMADEEGDGGDGVDKRRIGVGAFPTYSKDELPITKKNKLNKLNKKCNCK